MGFVIQTMLTTLAARYSLIIQLHISVVSIIMSKKFGSANSFLFSLLSYLSISFVISWIETFRTSLIQEYQRRADDDSKLYQFHPIGVSKKKKKSTQDTEETWCKTLITFSALHAKYLCWASRLHIILDSLFSPSASSISASQACGCREKCKMVVPYLYFFVIK